MAKTRISNEVGATVFTILAGLAAICLAGWMFGPSSLSRGTKAEEDLPAISPLKEEVNSQKSAEENSKLEAEAARRAELASSARAAKLERDELAEKLAVANKEREALLSSRKKLSREVATLTQQLESAESRVAEVSPTQSDRIRDLELKLNALGGERNDLNGSLDACQSENEALKKEVARLTALLKKQDSLSKQKPKAQANALRRAVDFPALDLPMLINDPNQLDPKLKPLFIRLREMKDTPDAREKIYAELAKEGKTEPMMQVPFEVGSDTVPNESGSALQGLVEKSGKAAKFLVVGYASVDGNPQSNYELSSRRASNVAQKIADGNENTVQAVYFGQTRRFDATEMPPNRVVEVWRVK